jgi:hypothetical protein
MKYVKMLGLAAVAAAALMAFVGAGTASATVLCNTETSPCTGTKYGVGQKIESHLKGGTEAVLVAGFATVKCTTSVVNGAVTAAGSSSATVVGNITTLDFTNCNCTVAALENADKTFGQLEIHYTSSGDGTLTGKNSRVTINCSGVSCIFGTAATGTTIGTVTGAKIATLKAEAKLPYVAGDASNFICTAGSGTGSWTANYEVTNPENLYVAAS